MSKTRVKTTYEASGPWGSTETHDLYCKHNHSCDITTFYDSNGEVEDMVFESWSDNDKWDAMNRLWMPFKDEWNGELKDGVEYYYKGPWED
jgi:hypothetical protein